MYIKWLDEQGMILHAPTFLKWQYVTNLFHCEAIQDCINKITFVSVGGRTILKTIHRFYSMAVKGINKQLGVIHTTEQPVFTYHYQSSCNSNVIV